MVFKASVWNSGMFNDKENEQKQKRFSSLVKNIKDAEVIENHLEYLKVKLPKKEKIENIIKDNFDGNGWVTNLSK